MATRKTTRKTPTRKTTTRKARGAASRRNAPVSEPNLLESANQIWMAGVGALARAQQEGPKMFESLVREGFATTGRMRAATEKALRGAVENVQDAVESRVDSARSQATATVDNIEKIVQTRVHRALHQLGVPTADEVTALTRKVNALNRNVEELIAAQRRTTRRRAGDGSTRRRGQATTVQ